MDILCKKGDDPEYNCLSTNDQIMKPGDSINLDNMLYQ